MLVEKKPSHLRAMQVANIEGYASIFNEPDLNGDIIAKGAFKNKFIPPHLSPAKMLYQHTAEKPIGVWTDMFEDEKGLFVRGQINLKTDLGRNVWHLLKSGALDGLSIGFKTLASVKQRGGRRLTKLDLWEVSIVTFPMASGARITAVGEPQSPLENYDAKPLASLFRGATQTLKSTPLISV